MILLGQGALNHPDAGTIRTLAGCLAQQTGMKVGALTPGNSAGAWWAGAVPHRTAQGMPAKTAGANASRDRGPRPQYGFIVRRGVFD